MSVARPARRRLQSSGGALTLSLVLTALAVPGADAWAADELGRLFFSPERRAALDRARLFNVEEKQQVAEGNMLSVNGLVRRSSGKRTVWVNGVAIHENSVTDVRVVGASPRGTVSLVAGENGETRVTVGTTVNRTTGERLDALNGGFVRVTPAPTPARSP